MANYMTKNVSKSTKQEKVENEEIQIKADEVQVKEKISEKKVAINVENIINENKILTKELNEMKSSMAEILKAMTESRNVQPTVIDSASKMDRPCTLIHLRDCVPGLANTINVNGRNIPFSRFGEKRSFRFTDMQEITSRYLDWFERGIFTLGDDCSVLADDFGLRVMDIPMTKEQYEHIAQMPLENFKEIIKNVNDNQKVIIAKTWMEKYDIEPSVYGNMEKIKILNKATGGFMKDFILNLSVELD